MNLKLYVGNLPFGASEEDLKKFFSEAGAVQSVKIIIDAYSGKTQGIWVCGNGFRGGCPEGDFTPEREDLDGTGLDRE